MEVRSILRSHSLDQNSVLSLGRECAFVFPDKSDNPNLSGFELLLYRDVTMVIRQLVGKAGGA